MRPAEAVGSSGLYFGIYFFAISVGETRGDSAGLVSVRTDLAYRRGVRFLLDTQLADGSWHVPSRAIPIQPYFESEFPHGHDQWISAAATAWAAMALAPAIQEPVKRAAR